MKPGLGSKTPNHAEPDEIAANPEIEEQMAITEERCCWMVV
jgi:hypothetical protein